MQIFASKLKNYINQCNKNIFLIHGGELIQTIDAKATIKNKLAKEMYAETNLINLQEDGTFDDLLNACNSLSLFTTKKIIELRLKGSINKSDQKILIDLIPNLPDDLSLIIVANKLTPRELQSKWFSLCLKHGLVVNASIIPQHQMPNWIKDKLQSFGLNANNDAIALLTDYFEGNLIACNDAINKLNLYYNNAQNKILTIDDIKKYIDDNARFKNFDLIDPLLVGDANRAFTILNSLKEQKYDPILVLWVIVNEARTLLKISADLGPEDKLQSFKMDQIFNKYKVWSYKKAGIQRALQRLSIKTLENILQQGTIIDIMVKGIVPEDPWNALRSLCLLFLGLENTLCPKQTSTS